MTLPRSPFKGLAYFGDSEYDRRLFFGRERESELVASNLMASRLTVLYGPSGVGKSSLLRAGISRRLRALVSPAADRDSDPTLVIVDAWRDDPVAAVATAAGARTDVPLADALAERAVALGGEVYLVLDQMEEYVLYHGRDGGPLGDELEDLLTRAGLPVHVLLGVRDDALADLDAFKRRLPGVFGNVLRLEHLTRAAARAAIEGPLRAYAELGGPQVTAEDELVEAVLDQVGAGRVEHGLTGRGPQDEGRARRVEAPYLQLVLERLWTVERERGSDVLRASTLDELGGATQIVEEHLGRALAGLDARQLDMASTLFNHLVTPSGTKIAHGVDDLARYANVETEQLEPVVGALDRSRIMRRVPPRSGGPPRYEIFHDVLAPAVLAWRLRYESERALAAERAEAARRHRRLAVVVAVALTALAGTLALAAWALSQREEAQSQREEARANARSAEARELAASALTALFVDPQRSLRLALRAAQLEPTARTEQVLRRTLIDSRLLRVAELPRAPEALAVSPDGTLLVATEGEIWLLDRDLRVRGSHAVQGRLLELRGDAAVFVSGRTISIVDPSTGEVQLRVTIPREQLPVRDVDSGELVGAIAAPESIRFAALGSGRTLLAVSDGTTRTVVVNALNGEGRYVLEQPSFVTALRFGPGKRALAIGGADGTARIWSVSTGEHRVSLRFGHVGHVSEIAFSPRATLVATASTDGTTRVWRVGSGQAASVLTGHDNFVNDVEFSPDGSFVVTAGKEGSARVARPVTAEGIAVLRGHRAKLDAAVFVAGGTRVATAGEDGTVRLWDSVKQPELTLLHRLPAPVEHVEFGRQSIEAISGGRRYVLGADGEQLRVEPAAAPPEVRAVDGATIALAGKTAVIRRPDGREIVLRGHVDVVTSARFSPDGRRVVTASRDHDGIVWDARSGRELFKLIGHFAIVSDARYSPDGRWIVTAGPSTAGLWDATTGAFIYFLRGHEDLLLSAAFDGTSRLIVTGSRDGTVRTYRCVICGRVDELIRRAEARLAAMKPR